MKQLYLFWFVLFLIGLLGCQEEVQQNETLVDFEKFEKSLPPAIFTDTSFLAFKENFLYMRDYTGPRTDSIEMDVYMECIEQYMYADSAYKAQFDSRSEFISYMLGVVDKIPEIATDCDLDGNQVGKYIRSVFQVQIRIVDLTARYEELQNEDNPWAPILAEVNNPQITPEMLEKSIKK